MNIDLTPSERELIISLLDDHMNYLLNIPDKEKSDHQRDQFLDCRVLLAKLYGHVHKEN
jgi:hypothetical protein